MTEREKMLSGELFSPEESGLKAERNIAKKLCMKYNSTEYDDYDEKNRILNELLGSRGKNCTIESPFFCDYGSNIELGENFYANHNLVILDGAKVKIGNNVLIAPNCGIYTAGHPLDAETRKLGLEFSKPITIGNDVWIGGGVQILPGVTIGSGCVIGAGSVVNQDIPDNSLAVGNPCRVVKKLND